MSIEKDIQALTAAVNALTAALTRAPESQVAAGPAAIVAQAPAQVAPVAPPPVAPQPAVAMPPPPFAAAPAPAFVPPAPVPAPVLAPAPVEACPFSDVQGCVKWVVERFNALGPRGAEIQGVLAAMGIQNLSAVQPAQFAELFARVRVL